MLYLLGHAQRAAGDTQAARRSYGESLLLSQRLKATIFLQDNLWALAQLDIAEGSGERAARLAGFTEAQRAATARPCPPSGECGNRVVIEAIRALLEPEAFAAAWAEGTKMTVDQAVAYALRPT